jgi:hypothetical protein
LQNKAAFWIFECLVLHYSRQPAEELCLEIDTIVLNFPLHQIDHVPLYFHVEATFDISVKWLGRKFSFSMSNCGIAASKSEVIQPAIERALLMDPFMTLPALHAYVESSLNVKVKRHMVNLVKRKVQHNSVDLETKLFSRLPDVVKPLTLKDPEGRFVTFFVVLYTVFARRRVAIQDDITSAVT